MQAKEIVKLVEKLAVPILEKKGDLNLLMLNM